MQETVAKVSPLIHLGEELRDLDMGDQPVGQLSERLGGFGRVLA
jgi:hypothetical protein